MTKGYKFHYIYKDISEDIQRRFDTSNYELDCNSIEKTLPKEKNKKLIGLIKDQLGREIITKFVGLRAKTYIYLISDGSEDKATKENLNLKIVKNVQKQLNLRTK